MATQADKQNIGVITTIVVVGTFAMIAVSMAVTAMVRAEVRELGEEVGSNADLETVKELKGEQRAGLQQAAHWSDKGKGLVAIPLDRAMQLVTRDIQKNPHSATPAMPTAEHPDGGVAPPEAEPEATPAAAPAAGQAEQTPGKPAPSTPAPAPAAQGGSAGTASSPAAPPSPAAPVPTPPASGGGPATSPQ